MEKIIIPSFTKPVIKAPKDQKLMQAAQSLEASFLSEMLKAAKLGETSSTFGGGIGEDQLESFLRNERAKMIAEHQSIGLAEQIYNALVEAEDNATDH